MASAILAISACNKEQLPDKPAGVPLTISATAGALDVTTDTYTRLFAATAYGTIKYTLNDFYSSDLNTSGGPKTQVFYAPIFSEGDLEEGYTLRFHYGGRSKEGWGASWERRARFTASP